MDQKLQKTTYINMLLDFYKELLTSKQRQYLELYYQEDLTLAEISEQFNVSRTAIFDNISRTTKVLEKYEQHLKLVQKYENRALFLNQLKELTEDTNIMDIIKKIEDLD